MTLWERLLTFDRRRLRRLGWFLTLFFSPPLLLVVPVARVVSILATLLWVNVVALPLALLGLPFFEVSEFGAAPRGIVGWGIVVLFWVGLAFVLSAPRGRWRRRSAPQTGRFPRTVS